MNIPFMNLKDGLDDNYEEIINKINELIDNTRFIGGEEVNKFEEEFANYCNTKYAVGCSNGTDALILALKALDIKAGDKVLVPANTFIATSEAVTAVGAEVDFVDIEEDLYTISPQKLEEKINEDSGNIKAIIPVHMHGQMANMPEIALIAQKYNLKVIEDSAQAHGAKLDGFMPGKWGDIATYSFYPGKNLGAFGDAGAVTTNNFAYYKNIKRLTNHGRWDEKYLHPIEGYNKRIDSIQAAVLRIKLKKLDHWNKLRNKKASVYNDNLRDKDLITPKVREKAFHVWHLFIIRIKNRDKIKKHLKANGISAGIHYPVPLHLQPAYKYKGYVEGDFPVTEKYAQQKLSLPFWPEITEEMISAVSSLL